MIGVISEPDTQQKLRILSADAQYDLACACATGKDEHRKAGDDGKWIYPVTLPNGGTSVLFKTLVSNVCSNDCKYCPLRENSNIRRCTLSPEETVRIFLDYFNRGIVFGLFLSSACAGSADSTMERLNTIARILRRRHRFRGYIHLKIIPGASDAAVEQAVSLASAVSVNIEVPGEKNLRKLSDKKNYIRDIIEPIKLVSRLTGRGAKYSRVKQTTQFIVGAAGETDAEIVKYTAGLYDRLSMHRVYFSAYQKGLGDDSIPGENQPAVNPAEILLREHRLYQVDFLFRKYGFELSDIIFTEDGQLSMDTDPKLLWAQAYPGRFPVNINKASKFELLRVPGLGPVTVNRILKQRVQGRLTGIADLGKPNIRLRKAQRYIVF